MGREEIPILSDGARKNRARLGTAEQSGLNARANKRLSEKHIIPTEYVSCTDTLPLIEKIADRVRRNGWNIADVMASLCASRLKAFGITPSLPLERKVSPQVTDEVCRLRDSSSRTEAQTEHPDEHLCSVEITAELSRGHLISRASPPASPQGEASLEDELPQSASLTAPSRREPLGRVRLIEELADIPLSDGEWDILGLIYQSLLTEGEKNRSGAYYTPPAVVRDMVRGLPFESGQIFLDPCCGSGSFLLGLVRAGVPTEQIFGCDIDPVAVMIAKTNLICECGQAKAATRIVCGDFLTEDLALPEKFDYILTNPPWGAMGKGESFSDFLHKGCEKLGENGAMRYLLPDSFLNVRTHREIRRHLLEKECITQIRLYDERFEGVSTGCIGVEVRHGADAGIHVVGRGMDTRLNVQEILQDKDCVIALIDDIDRSIWEKVCARGRHTLEKSVWALGIVTGDNQRHLKDAPSAGNEPVYTGKEVGMYRLSAPRRYIRYDRSAFQQCAKEEYYRAAEKLIYRFISDRPVFALDISGALCLNSANILIPKVDGLSVRTVMGLLNSRLYQYLYIRRFGGVKILKGNLQKLPLPQLSVQENEAMDVLVQDIMNGSDAAENALQTRIFELFGLTQGEISRIFEVTKGRNKS